MKTLVLIGAVGLAGCAAIAPTGMHVAIVHTSHPLIGWPVESNNGGKDEDGLTQVSMDLDWDWESGYFISAGLGWNAQGRNGGGMLGSSFLSSFSAGKCFRFRAPR